MARTMICAQPRRQRRRTVSLLSNCSSSPRPRLRCRGCLEGRTARRISKSRAPTPNTSVRQETLVSSPLACPRARRRTACRAVVRGRRRPWGCQAARSRCDRGPCAPSWKCPSHECFAMTPTITFSDLTSRCRICARARNRRASHTAMTMRRKLNNSPGARWSGGLLASHRLEPLPASSFMV